MSLITDSPATYNLDIYKGATFKRVLRFTDDSDEPEDLEPYTFAAEIREWYGGPLVLPITLTKSDTTPGELELTVPNIESEQHDSGAYVWDMRASKDGESGVIFEGTATIRPRVTQ